MNSFIRPMDVRWADMDPNFHMRHSVYYDYGATLRIEFLHLHGINPEFLRKHNLGPILFREECQFKREIRPEDKVTIGLQLTRCTPNLSRWTIQHQIFRNEDTLSAILTVDGAWIDIQQRKLIAPPPEVRAAFEQMPRIEGLVWS